MTTFLLIRHAAHDLLGNTLAGRTRDVDLNTEGARDAGHLVALLGRHKISAVYASPRLRARSTIEPFATAAGIGVAIEPGLDEIDFGAWSGRAFDDLQRDPHWSVWCNTRTQARPPGGETITDAQTRVIATMQRLRIAHGDAVLALVTHGDIVKAALAHYLHIGLDHLERFDIAPASLSVVIDDGTWSQVTLVNATRRSLP